MKALRKVHLYGRLADKFGAEHNLYVSSPAEAIRLLCATQKGFEREISDGTYRVVRSVSSEPIGKDLNLAQLHLTFGKKTDLHVLPDPQPAGIETILLVGLGLVAAVAAVALFAPTVSAPDTTQRDSENTASWLYDGPVNVQSQGSAYPLAFGKPLAGSLVVAGSIKSSDTAYDPTTGGSGGAGGGGPGGNVYEIPYVDTDMSKGGKGGGDARTPVEDKNTLIAEQTAYIVDIVSQGPIGGLVNGMKSVFVEMSGTWVPVQNADDTYNVSGFTLHERTGLPMQSYMPGFESATSSRTFSDRLLSVAGGPLVEGVSDEDVNKAIITIKVESLAKRDTTNGDLKGSTVAFKIEVQSSGGSYVEVKTKTIIGKTTSEYPVDVEVELPAGGAPWNIRLTRLTPDAVDTSVSDRLFFSTITEVIDAKITYPNKAAFGWVARAKQFGNTLPRRAYEIYGIECEVPTNFNTTTRTYATTGPGTSMGGWDGTFKREWTDDPPWIFREMLVNKKWGLGRRINADNVDSAALYRISQYCSEHVPDGFGGTEPRFSMNVWISDQKQAYEMLNALASAFDSIIYWSTGTVTLVQDAPRDVWRDVNPAKVIDGKFSYSDVYSAADRHSIYVAMWNDPSLAYKLVPEVVEDDEYLREYGPKEYSFTAYGCTSRGQARRAARKQKELRKSGRRRVKYGPTLNHAGAAPGKIVGVVDPRYTPGKRMGGLLKTPLSTTVVTLDRPTDFAAATDYWLRCTLPTGEIEEQQIDMAVTGSGLKSTITLTDALSVAPRAGSVWALRSSNLQPAAYSIETFRYDDDFEKFEIEAIGYDPTIYARVDQNLFFEVPDFYSFPKGVIQPPTDLDYIEFIKGTGTSVTPGLMISFKPSPDSRAAAYQVQYKRPENDQWLPLPTDATTSRDIPDVIPGTWQARARAMDGAGRPSAWVEYSEVISGSVADIPEPEDLDVYKDDVAIQTYLAWDRPDDVRPIEYEVLYHASSSTFSDAISVAVTKHQEFTVTAVGKYWVRSKFMESFSGAVMVDVVTADMPTPAIEQIVGLEDNLTAKDEAIADLVEVYGDTVSAAASATAAAVSAASALSSKLAAIDAQDASEDAQAASEAAQALAETAQALAAASQTAAAASASSAAGAATTATAQALAASGSATAAAGSATSASSSASAAAGSATAASGSATAASTSASGASVSAGAAATSATNASNSASAASTALTQAKSVVAAALPSTFENDSTYFTEAYSTYTNPGDTTLGSYVTVSGIGRVYQSHAGYNVIAAKGVFALIPLHSYRATLRFRVTANSTSGNNPTCPIGWALFDSAGSYLGAYYTDYGVPTNAAAGWVTLGATNPISTEIIRAASGLSTAVFARPLFLVNYNGAGNTNATIQFQFLKSEDVSSEVAAGASAAAAATSATTASTQATNAGTSATAAATSATNAATSAGAASTSAGAASTSATSASNSASTATTQANNAATSATAAANSATAAAGSASAASTSASTASTQATNAGNSATAAASSAVTAQSIANRLLPDRPAVAADFVNTHAPGAPDTATPSSAGTMVTVSGEGDVRQPGNAVIVTRGGLAVGTGRTFRLTHRARVTVDGTSNTLKSDFCLYDSSWTYLATVGGGIDDSSFVAADGWQTFSREVTSATILAAQSTAVYVRARSWGYQQSGGSNSGATWQIALLALRDVTSETAAAGSATAAASSASAASTSATNAGNSATSASNSATSAATSAGNASTSAGAASTSASSASSSASTATTQANNASTSATAAASSASAAAGSASAAATSASTASTQATNAGNSATSASASAVSAKSSMQTVFAANIGNPEQWGYNDGTVANTAYPSGDAHFTTASGMPVFRSTASATEFLAPMAYLVPVIGHTYRATIVVRRIQNVSNGRPSNALYGFIGVDTGGSVNGSMAYADTTLWTLNAWQTLTLDYTLTFGYFALRPRVHINYDGSGSSYSDARYEVSSITYQDVTSELAASGSASAAASSASAASTSATTAGTQASAASTSATNAATSASSASTSATSASGSATAAAGSATSASTYATNAATSATNAGTQATNASTSATNASNSAAAAASSAVLAASIGQNSIGLNPNFTDWTSSGSAPAGWTGSWGTHTRTRVAGNAYTSPYAYQDYVASGTAEGGFYQSVSVVLNNWYVMGAEPTLDAGTFQGAGLTLSGGHNFNFYTEADASGSVVGAGTTGRTYTFSKLFKNTSVTTGTVNFHAMTQWSTFAATASANRQITWRRVFIRPATDVEIETGIARNGSATLSAEIAARAATAATATAAVATSVTSLSAAVYANPNMFDNAGFAKGIAGFAANTIGMAGPAYNYPDLAPSVVLKGYAASATVGDYQQFVMDVPIDTNGDGTGTGRTGTFTFSMGVLNYGMSTGDLYCYIIGINAGVGTQQGLTSVKNVDSRSLTSKRASATVVITTASKYLRIGLLYATGNAYGGSGGAVFTWGWKLETGSVATTMSAEATINAAQSVAVDTAGKMSAIYSVDVSTSASKAGFVISSGNVSYFDVYADRFRIWDGAQRNLIFQTVGGQVQIQDALVAKLKVYPSAAATIAHQVATRPNLYSGADGATITFPGTYGTGNIPYIKWAGGIPPAVAAGETYDISASSPSPTGFVVRAKKFTPGTPTTYSTTSTTNPGGTPAWRAPKPNTLDADGGSYTFKFSGTALCVSSIEEVPGSGNWETNWAGDVQLWYRPNGGSFTLARTETVAFSSTEASQKTAGVHTKAFSNWEAPVNLPAIGADDGSKHFGIHASTGATITAFVSVAYTATSTSSVSALSGSFTFEVYAPT